MKTLAINFNGYDPLEIYLDESTTADLFYALMEKNLNETQPIWRDPAKYDLNYFQALCKQIKDKLGWKWRLEQFDLEKAVRLHKGIEHYVEKDKSFRHLPLDQQMLLHEAHYCIHNILHMDPALPRGAFLQFEWFTDDHAKLPEDAEFVHVSSYGDVELQNPYVGHSPMQCWMDNDFKKIDRTCAFHDIIRPGIKINLVKDARSINMTEYRQWWTTNCKKFVDRVGWSNIMRYTGTPVIGKVKDVELLSQIEKDISLSFESIEIK